MQSEKLTLDPSCPRLALCSELQDDMFFVRMQPPCWRAMWPPTPVRQSLQITLLEAPHLFAERRLSPQFSPEHGCGRAFTRIYGVALEQRARRTVKYVCALCLSRALYLRASTRPRIVPR